MRISPAKSRPGFLLFLLFTMMQLCSNAFSAGAQELSRAATLFRTIRSGSGSDLEELLSKGADANDTLAGYSALMGATLNGTAEQMKILIAHGADVNYQTKKGVSALWLAVPDWDKTILLLDHGSDVQHKIEGYNVLVKLAAVPGTLRLIRLLMDKGADPKKSASDNYLLYNAASSGDTAILGFFMRIGFNVNDTVSYGDAPINAALTFRTFGTLKMLVENGANVNFQSMTVQTLPAFVGVTPLMLAALSHDKPAFYYLLEHGADPNLRSKKGYTALMLLEQSEVDDPAMTLDLIKHGAMVSAKMPDGTDALYYANKRGNAPSVEILKNYAAK